LVGGDHIDLKVTLEKHTRLVLVTQGSTKLFKSPSKSVVTAQSLTITIGEGASLCYLPDPTQPFAESVYEQKQTFFLDSQQTCSLCVLDRVSEGRRARGESWSFWSWKGKNEVRQGPQEKGRPSRLLLRDALILSDDRELDGASIADKSNGLGVFGTLILSGPKFKALGDFFMTSFKRQPRIGAKDWSDSRSPLTEEQKDADMRIQQEKTDGLLWTAAESRGFVVVKFGAIEVNGARRWLADMFGREGSIEKEFGHQALIGLR